jgi:antitoxin component YwqK of YwqJK toxin-antitoxin module
MRTILLIFFSFFYGIAYSQKLPDYGLYRIRITEPDKVIVAGIDPVSSSLTAKPKLFYYWYSANTIHSSQGGFSGKLLNGEYTEYYPDRNLKEQGTFKNGLKEGVWKTWDKDGTLLTTVEWKKGKVKTAKKPLWKRVHLFSRKKKAAADSLINNKR